MVKKTAEKSHGGLSAWTSSSELSENKPRQNFRLGDITWVKHGASSWWPAQVIDEASVSSKPKKKTSHDALVRLYGTCQYLYVDPWKSNMEFEMILKEENKTVMEAFHEVFQKELAHFKSPSDHDEEPVSTKAKTSGRKVRKREGLKQSGHGGVKEISTTEGARQHKKGSVVDGAHREIKTMVRDILLGDVVARQQASEMAYVDEVVFGICDSSNAAKRPRKGNDSNSSPSRDAAMEGSGQRSARQIKIMQKLGLVAPPGSPFKGLVVAAHR